MKIINLTQHVSTAEQRADGVFEPSAGQKESIKAALTFESANSFRTESLARASMLAEIASDSGADGALIGGAPYFMSVLESKIKEVGVEPMYSFSQRKSSEWVDAEGVVQKAGSFKHIEFI